MTDPLAPFSPVITRPAAGMPERPEGRPAAQPELPPPVVNVTIGRVEVRQPLPPPPPPPARGATAYVARRIPRPAESKSAVSNSLAVAMVTAALRRILGEALVAVPAGGVENARVTTLRPDMLAAADGDARGINIFLYQVAANPAWAGNALPTRRDDGSLLNRPEQALDLHYLLTFSGDENALEPQRMLGMAVTALVAGPVLGRQQLRDIIAAAVADDPATWQQFSDLPDQVELVRFTPQPLSLDDISKLWSNFYQAPYRLSTTYQASVVLLDADMQVQPALPVLTRGVDAAALTIPVVSRVVAGSGPADPIVPGTTIRIEGQQLRGTYSTRVRLDDAEVPVPPDGATGTRLTLTLPANTLAGLHGLQVLHPRLVGTPPVERAGAESAIIPLLVRPGDQRPRHGRGRCRGRHRRHRAGAATGRPGPAGGAHPQRVPSARGPGRPRVCVHHATARLRRAGDGRPRHRHGDRRRSRDLPCSGPGGRRAERPHRRRRRPLRRGAGRDPVTGTLVPVDGWVGANQEFLTAALAVVAGPDG